MNVDGRWIEWRSRTVQAELKVKARQWTGGNSEGGVRWGFYDKNAAFLYACGISIFLYGTQQHANDSD